MAETASSPWRTLLIVAAIALAAYLVWRWRRGAAAEDVSQVQMTSNATPPPEPPAGTPASLPAKMAQVVDTQIPVVMTAGEAVPYDEDEVKGVVKGVLDQLNARDESVTLIQVVNTSKTVDSYKTVAYDLLVNVHDNKASVGLQMFMSVLVAATGKRFVRALRLAQSPEQPATQGPAGAGEGEGELAPYQDPIDALKNLKLD